MPWCILRPLAFAAAVRLDPQDPIVSGLPGGAVVTWMWRIIIIVVIKLEWFAALGLKCIDFSITLVRRYWRSGSRIRVLIARTYFLRQLSVDRVLVVFEWRIIPIDAGIGSIVSSHCVVAVVGKVRSVFAVPWVENGGAATGEIA